MDLGLVEGARTARTLSGWRAQTRGQATRANRRWVSLTLFRRQACRGAGFAHTMTFIRKPQGLGDLARDAIGALDCAWADSACLLRRSAAERMAAPMEVTFGLGRRNGTVVVALVLLCVCGMPRASAQDGARIVFGAYERDPARGGFPSIYMTTPEGAWFEELTDTNGHDTFPAWSNDGRTIAFPSVRGGPGAPPLIYLMSADGDNLRPVTNGPDDWGVTFSPDDSAIAYGKWGDDDVGVYVTDLRADRHTRITDRGTVAMDPSWRPVGDAIAYSSDRTGFYDLHTMTHDGIHLEALTDRRASDGSADWHPRAKVIAFVSYGEEGGNGDIHTMRPTGPTSGN